MLLACHASVTKGDKAYEEKVMGKGQDNELRIEERGTLLTLFVNDVEAGYLKYSLDEGYGRGEADMIRILAPFLGKGYSHALVQRLIEIAVANGVYVLKMLIVNPISARIFSRYGRFFLTSYSWYEEDGDEVDEDYFVTACPAAKAAGSGGPCLWVNLRLHHDKA
jgi:GNAT superfamily N-acetyltransferase